MSVRGWQVRRPATTGNNLTDPFDRRRMGSRRRPAKVGTPRDDVILRVRLPDPYGYPLCHAGPRSGIPTDPYGPYGRRTINAGRQDVT